MQTQNKGGDVLASGAVRAQFPPAGGNVTQEKWDSIFADEKPIKSTKKRKKPETKEHICTDTCNVSE